MLDQVSSGAYHTKSNTAWCKLSNSFRVGEAESGGPYQFIFVSQARNESGEVAARLLSAGPVLQTYTRLASTLTISGERNALRRALIRQINLFQILNYKVTMTIEEWMKEEKMRLGRFKIYCVNAQKEEAKSLPLKMPRSCWSGQYRTWDDSLDALSIR